MTSTEADVEQVSDVQLPVQIVSHIETEMQVFYRRPSQAVFALAYRRINDPCTGMHHPMRKLWVCPR